MSAYHWVNKVPGMDPNFFAFHRLQFSSSSLCCHLVNGGKTTTQSAVIDCPRMAQTQPQARSKRRRARPGDLMIKPFCRVADQVAAQRHFFFGEFLRQRQYVSGVGAGHLLLRHNGCR